MKYFLIFLSLMTFSFAEEIPLEIASDLVESNGKQIILKGHAYLNHAIGKMEAKNAYLMPDHDNKKKLLKIKLEENVHLKMHKGGQINAFIADLDFKELKAIFLSDGSIEPVIYKEVNDDNNLQVEAKKMQAILKDKPHAIDQLLIESNVLVSYNNDYLAKAESAKYTKDEISDTITLYDQVEVSYKKTAIFSNPENISIVRRLKDNKIELDKIYSEGTTEVTFLDSKEGKHLTLKSNGSFTWNHPTLQAFLESKKNDAGIVEKHSQIHFSSSSGDVYADRATMNCKMINKILVLDSIVLEGNVWLLKNNLKEAVDPESCLECALADTVEYTTSSKELKFKATPETRVLFLDRKNHMQISAPSILVYEDPNTKKDVVKGLGDVRFSFIDKEFEKLEKHFGLYELNKKEE